MYVRQVFVYASDGFTMMNANNIYACEVLITLVFSAMHV